MLLLSVFEGQPVVQAGVGLAIFAFAIIVAMFVSKVLIPLATRLTKKTETVLDDLLVRALSAPVGVLIVVQGSFAALSALSEMDRFETQLNEAWIATTTAVAFWLLQRLVNALLTWYGHEVAVKTQSTWDEQALPIIRRVLSAAILAIGVLVILDEAGVSISPLLASLGIGGLAVALALQPTLANFFSGTSVLSDGSIRPGDFIEIQGGPMGTVHEVGWRTTRIISPTNNLVIIPNSKLADSIVTNYHQPDPEMNIWVTCGVSYEADLDRVEQVAKEVMREVRDRIPQAVKTFEPVIMFRDFGESNISFIMVLRGVSRAGTYAVQSELVKAVHRRFRLEGIEVNYPVRKLIFPTDGASDGAAAGALRDIPRSPVAKPGTTDAAQAPDGRG